jgi:hypothetical protein
MTRLTKAVAALWLSMMAAPALTVQAAAPPGRYTASSGTVLDTKTRLVWQQPFAASSMTWAAAKSYCAGLGTSLGASGWRLPTIKELQTLVDVSVAMGPSIDATYFPNAGTGNFWSSTPSTADTTAVWVLSFNASSGEGQAGMSGTGSVRCVR